jgi:hypothetical protein
LERPQIFAAYGLSISFFPSKCLAGLSISFVFLEMFGRDEKLKFPSEIPYHKEVCVNDSAEFLHLELVIPFFPNDKVLFDLTS